MITLIINRDRVTLLKNVVEWCLKNNLSPVIVDNASTYPPLMEYYEGCSCPVLHMDKNYGSHVIWDRDLLSVLGIDGQYIVTDSDLDLSQIPGDFLQVLQNGLAKYKDMVKCGLSLEINDLPNTHQAEVIRNQCEKKYWQKALDTMYFKAAVASTFALYRETTRRWQLTPSIRTNRPYTAKHVPWYYESFEDLPEDEKYYFQNANISWCTGKERVKAL